MNTIQISYMSCIVLTGLLSGLFYGWQCSVINGLAVLPDKEYLMAFQGMNKAIQNPVFFLSFMGSLIALALTTYIFYKAGANPYLPYLILSFLTYTIGVFGITAAVNVPLNNTLAAHDILNASGPEMKVLRLSFETQWNKWHLIRTWASVVAFVILLIPLIKKI